MALLQYKHTVIYSSLAYDSSHQIPRVSSKQLFSNQLLSAMRVHRPVAMCVVRLEEPSSGHIQLSTPSFNGFTPAHFLWPHLYFLWTTVITELLKSNVFNRNSSNCHQTLSGNKSTRYTVLTKSTVITHTGRAEVTCYTSSVKCVCMCMCVCIRTHTHSYKSINI